MRNKIPFGQRYLQNVSLIPLKDVYIQDNKYRERLCKGSVKYIKEVKESLTSVLLMLCDSFETPSERENIILCKYVALNNGLICLLNLLE